MANDVATVANGHEDLWLEVSNIRVGQETSKVQLKAERSEEPLSRWWQVPLNPAMHKPVLEALDKKRPVLAKLNAGGKGLVVSEIQIQYADSTAGR